MFVCLRKHATVNLDIDYLLCLLFQALHNNDGAFKIL